MYHRRELWLLFLFALALAVGSLVQHLRHNFPELAQRLESVDQEEQNPAASTQISRAPEAFPSRPQKLSRSDRAVPGPIDLNRADVADLQRLPGIGPTIAQRIIEAREQRGRFEAIDELLTVPGIGAKKFDAIKELVTVETPSGG